MRLSLEAHPDCDCSAVSRLDVEIEGLQAGALELRYRLVGDVAGLAIPAIAQPARTGGLWRHSCFEAFVRPENGGGYVEFNFSPSTEWAAYRFSGYREGMTPAKIGAPGIEVVVDSNHLQLTATLPRSALPPGPRRLALSAVIEDQSGAKSYWALAHPPGRPDFHHEAGFACRLPAMEAP